FAISLAVAGAFALVATTFTGCSIFKKLQAAKVLIQTKMEYKDLTFDNVDVYDDVMELVNTGMDGFLPNPKAVMLVKDLSQNIINKSLGNANFDVYMNANNTTKDTLWINKLQIEIKYYGIAGFIDVSLTEGGEPVSQDFDIKKDVQPEDVEKLQNLVRDRLFDLLVNKWLGKIIK
ncbi:MAG: hypothetical protein II835_08545, partial [Fibrobacter sp.]|nr:hypothetical protein [Fibrobacter sp.]